ncbi:MAG: acyl-CoA thioesterase [Prevotella sp.]|jgi:acyl-CoA thioester hydrolase
MKTGKLQTTIPFKVRFSEVDAMKVVWHGNYMKYFEDAREAFGDEYGLSYQLIERNHYYAPIVDFNIKYRKPLFYDSRPEITITYQPTEAAKIVFDYEIKDSESGELVASAHSVQVFMDLNYELVWYSPDFYIKWKNQWLKD